jgi:tRNA (guanine37-N1)-methyltransferase
MRFDIITIFPAFFAGPLDYGIVRRARESGLVEIGVHDLREFTHDRHRTVDDRPFGGGEGMVLKPEPLFEAVESILGAGATPVPGMKPGATQTEASGPAAPDAKAAVILLSASGKLFRQSVAQRLAALDRVMLLCGRYEGVDERVAEHLATDEISIGDFVLSGGELAAALVVDAVTRLLPGALGNEASAIEESFSARGESAVADRRTSGGPGRATLRTEPEPAPAIEPLLLDYPHYTRPPEYRGWPVPEILLSGNHEEIRRWRREMALEKTRRNRPDLLRSAT